MPDRALDVLIVEDEALLVMDLEAMIEEAGHRVVAEAASLREVRGIPAGIRPDIAFVDIQLAEGSSGLDVCAFIQGHWAGVVVVLVTANPAKVPKDFSDAYGIIAKPYSRNGMMAAMRFIGEGVRRPPPVSPLPASLVPLPGLAAAWM